jgi:hypothetical protein
VSVVPLNLTPQLLPYNSFSCEWEASRDDPRLQLKGPKKHLIRNNPPPQRTFEKGPETNGAARALKPPAVNFSARMSALFI